jgi:hypothetical protein
VLIDLTRIDNTRVVIVDFIVGDETGIIKMRIRNGKIYLNNWKENYSDLINAGDTIIVRNCKVPVVNSHMRMSVDAFGKIEITKDVSIDNVKLEKDFSDVVYDNLSDRKRFGGFNDNYNNNHYRNDNNRHKTENQLEINYN